MANKTRIVAFKVSPADYDQLKRRAEMVNQSLSKYVRERAFTFQDRKIAMIQFPDGTTLPVGEVEKGELTFAGPEYDDQKAGGNGEAAKDAATEPKKE